ncbi:T9SS type A sorting domain-containing protein [Rasiella sp. SM2506]|uniref:T9SS type A sorting domain-containing protein n=1 Tax=Rasiella sp. SM2506 TaxID=3423914 RepID=UPI003D7ADA47
MKKITFLAAALVGFAGFAQSFEAASEVSSTITPVSTEAVLWDQPREDTGGIVSCINNVPSGVFSADDFVLTDSNRIDVVTVVGFNNNANLAVDLTGFSLYIYADAFGLPSGDPSNAGDGVFEAIELDPLDPALTFDPTPGAVSFSVDITMANGGTELVLPAGTYWVVAAPSIDIPDFDGDNRWNWNQATEPAGGEASALLIDVDDNFAGGFTTWTDFATLGIAWDGLQFTVEGEQQDILSVGDNLSNLVSIFPNPASDVLNVKVPTGVSVQSVTMYDVLGKDTGLRLSNGTINTSNLARGVYILNIATDRGTLTEKIVKQ